MDFDVGGNMSSSTPHCRLMSCQKGSIEAETRSVLWNAVAVRDDIVPVVTIIPEISASDIRPVSIGFTISNVRGCPMCRSALDRAARWSRELSGHHQISKADGHCGVCLGHSCVTNSASSAGENMIYNNIKQVGPCHSKSRRVFAAQ